MAADETGERTGFSDLLADLNDRDIVIEVGGASSPEAARTQSLRDAVEASYRALAGSAPVQLETVAVVDEIARHSLSLWLRAEAGGGDPSLLKFLARGTLAIIAWMDGSNTHQLADLQQALRVLAWGTSITTTAHPALPSSADLVKAVTAWQQAKDMLGAQSAVRIATNNGSAQLDLSKRVEDPRSLLLSRKLVNHSADMIFVVELPDYRGTGKWLLKHGEVRTTAVSEPGTLLDKFYRRELDIRPGDGLRCKVDFETLYGPDHEVLSERYRIVEIVEVLPTAAPTGRASEDRSAIPLPGDLSELESAS